MPDDRLDMAAANRAASTNPDIPTGRPATMKWGNNWSAALVRVWPDGISELFF